ncbi:two-component system, NarL family, sensor histidine kinase ComP [Thalassobacillus cyri]|uniref:histidine kinase n=1 Tax=Thalassobacillus cyri TaxID=571932 RepID=A0A1H4BTX7_9BACI|nr:ATP-binding protein [Thalassobacillus cyri]SEA51543.1 two-component system, NarL family, sensor histidine kinase ComP [Thalassobacillus cyri]
MGIFSKKSLIISLFFVLSACYLLYVSLAYPYIGIEVEERAEEVTIVNLEKQGWAINNNVPVGSSVITIDGKPPLEHFSVPLNGEIEKVHTFTIEHEGQRVQYENIDGVSLQHWLLYIILPVLFFLVISGIAYFLYGQGRPRHSSHLLILFFLTIALGYMSNSGAIRDDLYASFLNVAMFLFAPVILLHFLYEYFNEFDVKWFSRYIYQLLYIIVGVISSAEAYFLMTLYYPSFMDRLPAIILFFLILFSLGLILSGYFKYRTTRYGPMFKYMNLGMGIAFLPYILFYLIPGLLIREHIIPLDVAAIFAFALPVTFVYLVTRQRLMDITFVMGRVRYYTIISFLPSIIILVVGSLLVDPLLPAITLVQLYLFIHVVFIIFLSLKESLDFRLQRRLIAAKYSYQDSMHRLSQDMKKETNVVELLKRLRYEIKNVLNVREVYVFSKNLKDQFYCVYKHVPEGVFEYVEKYLKDSPAEIGDLIETDEGFGIVVGHSLNKMTLLWCTGKKDFTTLNRDEKTYLQTIAHNTNIALENLSLIEDLVKELKALKNDQTQQYPTWLSRLLFTIAENQRKQLSIDLHDTVLQEQLYLYRKVDDLLQNRPALSESLKTELDMFRESLLDSIHLIRETCNELRPAFIEELGLVQSLRNLIQQYQLRSNFTVYFDDRWFKAELDQERILAIYRIVQELLSNAMKHSDAKIVKLHLYSDENNIYLQYADNGIGMDYSVQKDLFSHFGLSGIEQRINGFFGEMNVETAPGEGFQMHVSIPLTVNKGVLA